jgi:hypothetical protein
MKKIFNELLELPGVIGVLLIDDAGKIRFRKFNSTISANLKLNSACGQFIHALDGIREADLVFEGMNIHLQHTPLGYAMVLASPMASMAMIRLHSSTLGGSLQKKAQKPKGLRRWLARRQ